MVLTLRTAFTAARLLPHADKPSIALQCRRLIPRTVAAPQFRALATTPRVRQVHAEEFGDEEANVLLRSRKLPESPSYFTGNPAFTDNILALQELYRKYEVLPTVPADEAPRVRWKSLLEYQAVLGAIVKPAKYKKVLGILNRLNRINAAFMPQEVADALEIYKRPVADTELLAKPKRLDTWGASKGTGKRKTAIARVKVVEGNGEVLINGKPLDEAFLRRHDRESCIWPLKVTGRMDKYNIWAEVEGGGPTGQAEAVTLGVARALMVHEPLLKPVLRRAGCVTRDRRQVERKKPGHLKARKMPTWVKR